MFRGGIYSKSIALFAKKNGALVLWIARLGGTIRGRILLAFFAINIITAALGCYTVFVLKEEGTLVAKTFDESLMSINYARAASADFAAMEASVARRWITTDDTARAKLEAKLVELERSLEEDLTIVMERSPSAKTTEIADKVRQTIAKWSEEWRQLPSDRQSGESWAALDGYASLVSQQLDYLVNYIAGTGFTYRQSARNAVALDMKLAIFGTVSALGFSVLIALLLTKRITGPVAAASAVAGKIANGQLDCQIPHGSADELGALLIAMGLMRDNIKAMMEREVALRQSAQIRLSDAIESSQEGIIVVDAEGRIALANSQAADFFGRSLTKTQSNDRVIAPLDSRSVDGIDASQINETLFETAEMQLADGRWLRVSRSFTQEGGYIALFSDVSVQKDQETKLKATNLLLDAALDNMSQGLCLYDSEQRLKVVNRRFCEIFNLAPEMLKPGIKFDRVLELSIAAGNHPKADMDDLLAEELASMNASPSATRLQDLSGDRVIAITRQPIADGGWVATYEDITKRQRAEAQIVFMARHDVLTGLANRVLLAERIDQAICQIGRNITHFGLLCVDLDHFKNVNDTLGHPIGDALLVTVAQRLVDCVREIDMVGRLGGDEFAVVLCGLNGAYEVECIARRIVQAINEPFIIEGRSLTVGVSIGISIAPNDGMTYDKLLKNADVALYLAKDDGRGTWRFFEPEMDVRLQARRALEIDLSDALANNEFEVFYQPLFDFSQSRICGFEALVRWRHPTRGLVSPADFITLAEETGLIVPLGEWVLRQACAEALSWPSYMKVAVNVSPIQFRNERLLQIMTSALAQTGLVPERLELEITESVLLSHNTSTTSTLHALRNYGIRISMDDFGTGYSSLSYLHGFPFDKIKIDQSFVRTLSAEDGSRAIVHAMVALGSSLGIRTTAEGVETMEQLKWLHSIGCNEVQGYFFSRPVPAQEIPALLRRWENSSELLDLPNEIKLEKL
jgi:diguanylate cyclase (GGDEF)-like protein